jgi:hypothetical protein
MYDIDVDPQRMNTGSIILTDCLCECAGCEQRLGGPCWRGWIALC